LITGATGAIGLEILRQLKSLNRLDGIRVLARDTRKNQKKLKPYSGSVDVANGDITDPGSLKRACKDREIVIHLAAVIPPASEQHPDACIRINQGGTEKLIQSMEDVCPHAFLIFASSIAVYGDRIQNPLIRVTDPLASAQHDCYSKTKIGAEKAIRESGIDWCILRLTAIMGFGNHKLSGIMFDVPLATPMEICTVSDTARAIVSSIDKQDCLKHRVFNLSGGETCRLSYSDLLARSFSAFGMGPVDFPDHAFAKQNFHCGYYADGDKLEHILEFRADDIESYFNHLDDSIPSLQRMLTIPFARVVKWFLLRLSKPYQAYRKKDRERMSFYFGE
jgi:nucleoside-diphosphate-sugar epimerase